MVTQQLVQPQSEAIERFSVDLGALTDPTTPLGIAVSGGPDSLALLALAAAARPGLVEAATVNHAMRPESRGEADMVAKVSKLLGVAHRTLTVEWSAKPKTAIQERARAERYRLLGAWARDRGLHAIVTAHHLDDQAETFMMRLARGSGVRGLGAMRNLAVVPSSDVLLLRPLLAWRRAELESVCNAFGLTPVADPSNADEQFERVRVRQGISRSGWIDPRGIAASACNLAEADEALNWATAQAWSLSVTQNDQSIAFNPADTPREIRRRIVIRAVSSLATEGQSNELSGRELDRLVAALASGGKTTIRGVLCSGGPAWSFSRAPARKLSR